MDLVLIIRFGGNSVKIASMIDKMVGDHIFVISIVSECKYYGSLFYGL